jgi:SWI/SNF-related matrix-associated actin-dependent regulator 1 of chromatin subfamily A
MGVRCDNLVEASKVKVFHSASERKNPLEFGLPADHTLVYELNHLLGGKMQLDPRLVAFMAEEDARTKEFARLLARTDCEGDPRLYPYQRVDVDIMKRHPFVINHLPMGGGKTPEWLIATQGAPSALAVVPKGLMGQWAEKAEQWIGEEVTILHGTPDQKRKRWQNRRRLVVTTYNSMFTFEPLRRHYWGAIGWDEGHRLAHKGDSQRSEAAATMRSDHRSLLTGTLMRKHAGYFYWPLHMAFPYAFTSYYHFIKRFCEMKQTPFAEIPTRTLPHMLPVLQYILSGVMIQRKKEDIQPWLPEKSVETVRVGMTPSQARAYREMSKELETTLYSTDGSGEAINLIARTNGAKFVKLRCLSLDPGIFTGVPDSEKTDYILDYCEDADDKVVVFAWYKNYVDLIHAALLKRGINAVKMHSGNTDRQNEAASNAFKKDPNVQVIVGTIAKMGEGFDFPMATTVIFADVSYIPDDNRQGEERIWRPGQTKKCRIIYLVTRRTVDELVHRVVMERSDVITETMAFEAILEHLAKEGPNSYEA